MGAIGVDIGATSARAGWVLVEPDGGATDLRVHGLTRTSTRDWRDIEDLSVWLVETMEQVRAHPATCGPRDSTGSDLDAAPVGLALPGLIDASSGVVRRSVHLPFLEGIRLVDRLSRRLHRPITIVTDAAAATWGEYVAAGRPPGTMIHLRLGSGVACGLVVDGRAVPFDPDRTTHSCHLIAETGPDALPCACGLTGCLETIAGGRGLERAAEALGLEPSPKALRQAAERGDARSCAVLDRAARGVYRVIETLTGAYRPALIVIGGGVMTAMPELVEFVRDRLVVRAAANEGDAKTADSRSMRFDDAGAGEGRGSRMADHSKASSPWPFARAEACGSEHEMVRRAELGDEAGVVGAALLCGER